MLLILKKDIHCVYVLHTDPTIRIEESADSSSKHSLSYILKHRHPQTQNNIL